MTRLWILACVPVLAYAQAPTAGTIMSRVIENQDRAQAVKSAYVFDEDVFVRLQQPNGKRVREENRLYTVLPKDKGVDRTLVKLEGKVFAGKKTIPYTEPGFHHKNIDIDADITDSFAGHVMWKDDQDMPIDDWFPLNSRRAKDYQFEFKGEERYQDSDVYRIAFSGNECWAGEALIEKKELQPLLVTTAFDCKIPKAVTILLGINLTHLGAKITYQRVEPGVWFPATVGGELRIRIFFLYARTVAFRATNSGFRKADVKSDITFEDPVP